MFVSLGIAAIYKGNIAGYLYNILFSEVMRYKTYTEAELLKVQQLL